MNEENEEESFEKRELAYKKLKEGWIKVWFAIEAMAVKPEIVKSALKRHIEKLCKAKDIMVLSKKFKEVIKVNNPPRNVSEAFSQVVEVVLLAKDFFTLINIVMVYGPSAIEILEPSSKEIRIDEMQNIVNVIAGILHQFASAGAGGIVIAPERK